MCPFPKPHPHSLHTPCLYMYVLRQVRQPSSHTFTFRPRHSSLRLTHRHGDSVFTCTGLATHKLGVASLALMSSPFLPCSSVTETQTP